MEHNSELDTEAEVQAIVSDFLFYRYTVPVCDGAEEGHSAETQVAGAVLMHSSDQYCFKKVLWSDPNRDLATFDCTAAKPPPAHPDEMEFHLCYCSHTPATTSTAPELDASEALPIESVHVRIKLGCIDIVSIWENATLFETLERLTREVFEEVLPEAHDIESDEVPAVAFIGPHDEGVAAEVMATMYPPSPDLQSKYIQTLSSAVPSLGERLAQRINQLPGMDSYTTCSSVRGTTCEVGLAFTSSNCTVIYDETDDLPGGSMPDRVDDAMALGATDMKGTLDEGLLDEFDSRAQAVRGKSVQAGRTAQAALGAAAAVALALTSAAVASSHPLPRGALVLQEGEGPLEHALE